MALSMAWEKILPIPLQNTISHYGAPLPRAVGLAGGPWWSEMSIWWVESLAPARIVAVSGTFVHMNKRREESLCIYSLIAHLKRRLRREACAACARRCCGYWRLYQLPQIREHKEHLTCAHVPSKLTNAWQLRFKRQSSEHVGNADKCTASASVILLL